MRVWHFNRVITTYGKRDCKNSWLYASLAVNRGAIKQGFTIYSAYLHDASLDIPLHRHAVIIDLKNWEMTTDEKNYSFSRARIYIV